MFGNLPQIPKNLKPTTIRSKELCIINFFTVPQRNQSVGCTFSKVLFYHTELDCIPVSESHH